MKKVYGNLSSILLAVWLLTIVSGCSHTEVFIEPLPPDTAAIDNQQPVAAGTAYNSGYYLFNTWPIYTGNPNKPNRKDYRSFHDDIRPDRMSTLLILSMQHKYKVDKMINIEHEQSSWGWFSLWIVWRKTIRTSGIGVKTLPPAVAGSR